MQFNLVLDEAMASELERVAGYRPRTSVAEGVANFVDWHRTYFQ